MNGAVPLRVMLLIDADNVSSDIIEQAVEKVMAEQGAIHVRRAYCTAESAVKHLKLFKRLSIRPIVNISTGKNSTDIALAVDAIDLVIAERPQVVVIVSSDSDFAPLVCRLREKGCRVCGIGQQDKTGDETALVYDAFVDLPHRKAKATAKATAKAASRPADKPADKPADEPADKAPAKHTARTPAKRAAKATRKAAKKARAAKTQVAIDEPVFDVRDLFDDVPEPAGIPELHDAFDVTVAKRVPQIPDDVRRILDAVPELLEGDTIELNDVAKRLRAANVLAKSVSSPKLFKKYPELFALTPEKQPSKVQYLSPRIA